MPAEIHIATFIFGVEIGCPLLQETAFDGLQHYFLTQYYIKLFRRAFNLAFGQGFSDDVEEKIEQLRRFLATVVTVYYEYWARHFPKEFADTFNLNHGFGVYFAHALTAHLELVDVRKLGIPSTLAGGESYLDTPLHKFCIDLSNREDYKQQLEEWGLYRESLNCNLVTEKRFNFKDHTSAIPEPKSHAPYTIMEGISFGATSQPDSNAGASVQVRPSPYEGPPAFGSTSTASSVFGMPSSSAASNLLSPFLQAGRSASATTSPPVGAYSIAATVPGSGGVVSPVVPVSGIERG